VGILNTIKLGGVGNDAAALVAIDFVNALLCSRRELFSDPLPLKWGNLGSICGWWLYVT